MLKKYLPYILLFGLGLLVFILVLKNSKSTIKTELKDFAVEDTTVVDKVFLVDKQNQSILLERFPEGWQLNGQYSAREDLVNVLLKTLLRMRVKEPVSNAAKEQIIKNLAVKSTKVEVYENGNLSKVFYVGGPTKDSQGTYMIIDGAASPFVMEIPGFRGYLSPRFTTSQADWRSHLVFAHSINRIAQIRIEYISSPENSWLINNNEEAIELYDLGNNQKLNEFNLLEVRKYLMGFTKVGFSKFVDDVPKELMDSVLNGNPFANFLLTDNQGQEITFDAFDKPAWGKLDEFGEPLIRDLDYFFIRMQNGELVYAQYFVFDPIFKGLKEFL